MTTSRLHLALALGATLAATACTTAASDGQMGGSNDPGDTGSDGGSDDAPQPTDAAGKYQMSSTYDLASEMPGKIGTVANMFIAATDDPDDPTNWLLTQIIDAMPDGSAKSFLSSAKDYVSGYLNDNLLAWAPNFVSTIVTVGKDFGDITKHFGMLEELDVTGATGAYSATHIVNGMHFKFGSTEEDFAFADYSVANVSVPNVGVTLSATGKLTLAQHDVPLEFGQVLRIALDNGIIPTVDPNATDIASLFGDLIDCDEVGQEVDDAIGFGGASTYAAGCRAGLTAAANYLYAQIAGIDSDALDFSIAGSARAVDTNSDGAADKLQTGTWSGQVSYAGTPAPLATATFHAERM